MQDGRETVAGHAKCPGASEVRVGESILSGDSVQGDVATEKRRVGSGGAVDIPSSVPSDKVAQSNTANAEEVWARISETHVQDISGYYRPSLQTFSR